MTINANITFPAPNTQDKEHFNNLIKALKSAQEDRPFQGDPVSILMTVTQDMAKEFLDFNEGNRKIDKKRVRQHVEELKKGGWLITNDGVAFNRNGVLCNGQHRLLAIAFSGIPARVFVILGLEKEAFAVMDTGKSRTPGTVLGLGGISDATRVSAIVGKVWGIERVEGNKTPKTFGGALRSNADLLQYAKDNEELLAEAVKASNVAVAKPKSLYGALYFILVKRGGEQGRKFMTQLLTGEGVRSGDPAYVARERALLNNSTKRRIDQVETADFIIHAWHNFLDGKKIKRASRGRGNFPTIRGM